MPEPPRSVQKPSVGVVLSTYNQPAYLRLALETYGRQTHRPDRVLIADDGSGPETMDAIRAAVRETGLRILHVWHPDRGFRKSEILNRAIAASVEDILIFSDGDCLPRGDFVATHLSLTRPGRFVSGGYLKLSAETTREVTLSAVQGGSVISSGWLRPRGWRPGRRALRLLPGGPLPALLDGLTPTGATWNGHNASTYRAYLIEANGFDVDMAYGGQDRALGERLVNAGVRGTQARHRLPVVHLDHGRPYADSEGMKKNRETRRRIRGEGETRARVGIREMTADPELVVTELP